MLLSPLEKSQAASVISHNRLASASTTARAARAPHWHCGTGLLEAEIARRPALYCTLAQATWLWVTCGPCDTDLLTTHCSNTHGHPPIWQPQLPGRNGHTHTHEHLARASSCVCASRRTHKLLHSNTWTQKAGTLGRDSLSEGQKGGGQVCPASHSAGRGAAAAAE